MLFGDENAWNDKLLKECYIEQPYVFSWLALPLAFGDSLVHSVPKLPVSS